MVRRPAFGRAVLCARGKHVIGAALQLQAGKGFLNVGITHLQSRTVSLKPALTTECGVKRHHGWFVFRVLQPVRQQADARFAKVADALRDAGQKRQQGTFERVGQHVSLAKAAFNAFCNRPPFPELQAAVSKGEFNDFGHLRHRPVDRRHPGQRPYSQLFAARMQPAQQRLGHHRVAYPLRGNNQRSPPEASFGHLSPRGAPLAARRSRFRGGRLKGKRHASGRRRNVRQL